MTPTPKRIVSGRALDEGRQADAQVPALDARFGLPPPESGKVHELGDALQ